MLLIIPAVSACVMLRPASIKSEPRVERLKVRRPVFMKFHAGDELTVQAASQRGGELLVAPLTGKLAVLPLGLAE